MDSGVQLQKQKQKHKAQHKAHIAHVAAETAGVVADAEGTKCRNMWIDRQMRIDTDT